MNKMVMSMWKGNMEVPVRKLMVPDILEQVAWDHQLSVKDLLSTSRRRAIAYARFDAMSRLRAIKNNEGQTRFSTPHIGRILGLTDHTSVLWGLKRWKQIEAERLAKEAA